MIAVKLETASIDCKIETVAGSLQMAPAQGLCFARNPAVVFFVVVVLNVGSTKESNF